MIGVVDKYKIDSSFLMTNFSLFLQHEALLALYAVVGIVPSVEVDTRRVAVLLFSEVLCRFLNVVTLTIMYLIPKTEEKVMIAAKMRTTKIVIRLHCRSYLMRVARS